MTAGDWRRRR